jgi:hypothetical protein
MREVRDMRRLAAVAMLGLVSIIALEGAADDSSLVRAKQLFGRYVALEHAFDPTVADLYSDDAVIRNKRTYPTGQVRQLTIPAPKYKELLRASMPLAKARGDTSTYSDVRYVEEGKHVRIAATRFSNLKKYSSPISLLVGPSDAGGWLIYEELSESQP